MTQNKTRVKGVNTPRSGTTTTTTQAPSFTFLNRNVNGGISNTLIEIYSYSDRTRPPMLNLIDSGVTDVNGYFYSYISPRAPRGTKYLFKCYDTLDNSGNVTWYGYVTRGGNVRPLPRSVDYDITVYSNIDNNPIVGLPIIAREYVDSSNSILGIPIDNKGIIGVTDSNGTITGQMVVDYRLEFGTDIFTDDNGVVYKASWQFGAALVGETTFTQNMGIDPSYGEWQLYSIPGNNLISLDQVDGLGNLISNIVTFPDTSVNDASFFQTLIGGLNYRINVYDGTDNPPLTEPIYTETWTAVWNEVHRTDLSNYLTTTTTTTTEAPTTTTTTTEAPTTTTTTTVYSPYNSITAGSVSDVGRRGRVVQLNEFVFDFKTEVYSSLTTNTNYVVMPLIVDSTVEATGPLTLLTDGVGYRLSELLLVDGNSFNGTTPSSNPVSMTVRGINVINLLSTDVVKFAVIEITQDTDGNDVYTYVPNTLSTQSFVYSNIPTLS